jgi:hypothetical protein
MMAHSRLRSGGAPGSDIRGVEATAHSRSRSGGAPGGGHGELAAM